jgi:hypothetical protein
MKRGMVRAGYVVWGMVGITLTCGVLITIGVSWRRAGGEEWGSIAAFAGAGITLLLVLGATVFAIMARPLRAVALAGGACLITFALLLEGVLPGHPWLWLSTRAGESVARVDPRGRRDLASVGYHEDSLIFETRGRVEFLSPQDEGPWLEAHPRGLLLRTAGNLAAPSHTIETLRGFNYSNGRVQILELVEPERSP